MSEDPWQKLKSFTDARIALGRSGGSLKTHQMLQFRKDHSLARDAVWANLDSNRLVEQLAPLNLEVIRLNSQAKDRASYIKRPDLGRKLDDASIEHLKSSVHEAYHVTICIADGLSALAIERHAFNFLVCLMPIMKPYRLAPITVVSQGRVAISDEIGSLLKSKLSIILIGERPGLSSPDSMGIYLTYQPQKGNTDERRNCISNIRKEGLSYEFAASKLSFLISESLRRKLSGVDLKDTFDANTSLPPDLM